MNHTYEEIRSIALEVMSGSDPGQYAVFKEYVARKFEEREGTSGENEFNYGRYRPSLSDGDANVFLEVFWGLFREGIITLGLNDNNPNFPFFRLSAFGRRIINNQEPYFFHDVATYESLVKSRVPNIDNVTLLYLKEAVQAFKAGCLLSATVMLGVATEHSFLLLLDTIEKNPTHSARYKKAYTERTILKKLNSFKTILQTQLSTLSPQTKEDLDTELFSALTMIRNLRNESGHPSGNMISREQCYVLLQLFIPCCRKIYQLIHEFK